MSVSVFFRPRRASVSRRAMAGLTACGMFLVADPSASRAQQPSAPPAALGVSNLMNPAISFNAILLGAWSDARDTGAGTPPEHGGEFRDGFRFQEGEILLTSVVDPYFAAVATVTFEPDEGTGIEEVYAVATGMPRGIGLRGGKVYLPFGKHNPLHTHQMPFVTAPLGISGVFGDHGVRDVGIEVSVLLPAPWYFEVLGYAVDGSAELFDADRDRLAVGGRASSLFDFGPSTFEVGASVLHGALGEGHDEEPAKGAGSVRAVREAHEEQSLATFWGGDATFRWHHPSLTHGPAIVWQNEIVALRPDEGDERLGFYTLARYRFLRRMWWGAGYSLLRESHDDEWETSHELRAQLAFVPSEFSVLRAEVRRREFPAPEGAGNRPEEWTALLQMSFTIGSHPAHRY